jgi:hypothetical protein
MDTRLIVCKCGRIQTPKGWILTKMSLSKFVEDIAKDETLFISVTFLLGKCNKCIGRE